MSNTPIIAALPKEPPPTETSGVADLPKTTGEKFYDGLQFTVGKAMIVVITAALANVAKYGRDSYGPVPNYLKKFQGWFHRTLLTNSTLPLGGKGEFAERAANAATNTMVVCHGGNAFAPVMKWMENNREDIANFINRRWGKPGETEIAHERLKNNPHQTWGDIFKGRMAAWGLVFGGFMSIDAIIGKDKKTGLYHFDKYEEWFGRKLAGFSKTGKDIAQISVGTALSRAQEANKFYRFGKVTALDLYATSAAIVIWNFVSRLSAKKRHEQNRRISAEGAPAEKDDAGTMPASADARRFSDFPSRAGSFSNAVRSDQPAALSPSL